MPAEDVSTEQYEDLLGDIHLYIDWHYITRQLTTEQKEIFADAVEAWGQRLDPSEGHQVDRWWRN